MRLFKSREEKELERRIRAKQGRTRITRHVENQRRAVTKYRELARRALSMGDQRQFRIIGAQYVWTQAEIERWERYVLMLDTIETRRDQAVSITEFIGSIKALTDSMMAQADPGHMAKLQKDLEMGLARAESLQEHLELMMDMTDQTLSQSADELSGAKSDELQALQQQLAGELTQDSADARITEGLKKLEEQLRKELP